MPIQILQYCIDQLFLRLIKGELSSAPVSRVMDLIRLMYPDLILKWQVERVRYFETRNILEQAAHVEMHDAFVLFEKRLTSSGLLENPAMRQNLLLMKSAIEGSPDVLLVPYLRVAYDHFKCLCYSILDAGRHDLIKDYANVRYSRSLQGYVIDNFMFTAFFELLEHDDVLRWSNRSNVNCPAWVAWDTLISLEWSLKDKSKCTINGETTYRENRDEVRRKRLCVCYKPVDDKVLPERCKDKEICQESSFRLYLHDLRAEGKTVKGGAEVFCFSEKNISNALQIIFGEIKDAPVVLKPSGKFLFPSSISFVIENDIHLRLILEWAPRVVEIYSMHTFQYITPGSNVISEFMIKLLDSPKRLVKISRNASGNNATKFLRRVGINGVLDKLFIIKKTSEGAMLRSARIDLTRVSVQTLEEVREYVQIFEHERWN